MVFSKSLMPFNQELLLEINTQMRGASEAKLLNKPMSSNQELEIIIHADGTVESAWWTPEIGKLLCAICGMQGSIKCITCMNSNPYCG